MNRPPLHRLSLALSVLVISLLGGLWACTPKLEYGATLSGEGILALSTTNAYLGSNLFIAREAERSQLFFNFLKGRGAPAAIKIVESTLERPTVTLYYTADKEMYLAELQERDNLGTPIFRQWIVRGPFAIPRNDYRELMGLQSPRGGEPIFQIYGRPYRFIPDDEMKERRVVEPALPPPPTPTPRPRRAAPKVVHSAEEEPTPPPPASFTPLNSDQLAILMSKGFAERASNGDVIHTVKRESETLAEIAKWYLGDASKTTVILESNNLATPESLGVGTRIRIPYKLVKEFKAMP